MNIRCIFAASTGAITLVCLAAGIGAKTPAQPAWPSAYFPAGDPRRGEQQAVACEPCHSAAAPTLGDPPVHAPRLRHQRASVIFHALQDYRAGRRNDPVMQAVAVSLGDQDMRNLAVYLAGERSPIPKPAFSAAHDRAGSVCAFCHGETGLGEMDGVPVLAGQHLDYLERALDDYRSGARANPTMAVFARQLTRQDAHDIAAYFAGYAVLEPLPAQPRSP